MKTLTVIAFLALTFCAEAQTNALAASQNIPNPAAVKVASDVQQLVLDLFTLVGGVSWSGVIISVYLAAKGLRNRTALGQAGKLGQVLSLLNLEAPKSNPQVTFPEQPKQ